MGEIILGGRVYQREYDPKRPYTTLIKPLMIDTGMDIGSLRQAIEADVFEDRRVAVIYTNWHDYPLPFAEEATPAHIKLIAEAAFADLGLRHPGVMDLFNFALRQGVMFDGQA